MWMSSRTYPLRVNRRLQPLKQANVILAVSEKHQRTVNDAAYLELAHPRRLPLATLDLQLRAAAQVEGWVLL
jgi:predicted nucleic acid-binding protein